MKRTLALLSFTLGVGVITTMSCKTEDPGAVPLPKYPGGCCGVPEENAPWDYCCSVIGCTGGGPTQEDCDWWGGTGAASTGMACPDTDSHIVSCGLTDSDSMTDTSADTGADSCMGWQFYTCRGWQAGVYANAAQRRFDFSSFGAEKYADALNFNICIESVGPADNTMLFEACETACEQAADWDYPLHPPDPFAAWTLDHVDCVFAPNAQGSLISGVIGDFYDSGKSWIPDSSTDMTVDNPQCQTHECVETEAECPALAEQSCVGWNPGSHITSSLNASLKTYTTTIQSPWLTALKADMFDQLMICDDGFWTWSLTASPDMWRMQGLTSTDFLYKMGFRNKDYNIRIKKTGTSTWYNLYDTNMLDGYAKMATAFGVLANNTSFVLEFRRPKTGGYDTYTMNLTLI